jgi:nitrogen fixation/metabolism regulation signal transduction histidine kinase
MTLRNRLFALVSAAVTVTVVLVTWTVSSSARQSFATLDAQRTAALVAQFRREFANEGEQVAVRVERIAQSDEVSRVAADLRRSRDYAPYVNEAASLAAAQGLDFLNIVAADGTIVSSAEWPARFGYKHPWAATPSRAAGPTGGFLQAVELPQETALGLVATKTVTAGGENLYLAGGRRLDKEFLQSLVLSPGMRALLYRNLQPEVTRQQLIGNEGNVPEAAPLEPLIGRVIQSRREASETIVWPEGPETVDALPLQGPDGAVLGVLLVGSSGRELAALVERIRWTGVAFGGLGIVLGFVLSYALAARVTRPVEQLANAARAVADGDWDVHLADLRTTGEIQVLSNAFETMTRQLVDHRERLVQAERVAAWRELARRLAHELKNPLFPLRITIDNLRRARSLPAGEFDEVFDESMTTLHTGLANLNAVIGRFSDFARMPAPHFAQVSPNEIVEQSVGLFQAQLTAPGHPRITVAVDLDPAIGTIRGDEEQIRRVIQNLLLNAIDAMPAGGALAIMTRRSNGVVRIDVSDSGEGLGEEERSRLFTPYYTTKQHGTGLGLAIVQSVVADHAGKIWVDSAPGQGATFHIELPVEGPA